MKDREYWSWLESQPDNIRKKIIEESPWYTLETGTHIWLNRFTHKNCYKKIDGHIYTQELGAESDEYVWEGVHYVNSQLTYETGTIQEYCDYKFSKTEFPKEIELFRDTRENYHHAIIIQLFKIIPMNHLVFHFAGKNVINSSVELYVFIQCGYAIINTLYFHGMKML